MLPMKAHIRVKEPNRKGLNLWLPLFLLWPVLLVLFILCLPLLLIFGLLQICRRKKMPKILSLLSSILGLLVAMRGLSIDVEDGDTKVKININ